MTKRLLLVGAGHAHLEVLRSLTEETLNFTDICLISPSEFQYYSGMFSGYTEGIYSEEDTRIDLRKLTKKAGIQFIKKEASAIRPHHKKLVCHDGSVYPFDVISFDIGSRSIPYEFEESAARSVKPNYQFIDEINQLRETHQPLIVGGGAAGTELALSIQAYKEKQQIKGQVRLITSEALLAPSPRVVSDKLRSILRKKGIRIWENERVVEVGETYVRTDRGNKVRHSGVLWLGGAIGDPIFQSSGVDIDEKGFAFVRSTLQFKNYDYIFGAGDCVSFIEHPHLPKSGVYAVREGPLLDRNLRRYLGNEELEDYKPQTNALYILSTGNHMGFLIYGPISLHTHRAWKKKNKIDRSYMDQYK